MRPVFRYALASALPTLLLLSMPSAPAPAREIPTRTLAQCVLGVTGPHGVNVPFNNGDRFYTLLRPGSCTACGTAPNLRPINLILGMRWYQACSVTMRISIVPAIISRGCLVPDLSAGICHPFDYTLTVSTSADFLSTIPLPADCCFTQDAFLAVEFLSNTCSISNQPALHGLATCSPCISYRSRPATSAPVDVCALGLLGNPIMSVEADCCDPTEVSPSSWGRLKTIYR